MKGVRLEFYVLNKVLSPPSFPAVGNLSQMSSYIHTCTKSTSPLTRYLYISFCRLSIVAARRCCWRVRPTNILSDIIFSCAYSPDEVIHILHLYTTPPDDFEPISG